MIANSKQPPYQILQNSQQKSRRKQNRIRNKFCFLFQSKTPQPTPSPQCPLRLLQNRQFPPVYPRVQLKLKHFQLICFSIISRTFITNSPKKNKHRSTNDSLKSIEQLRKSQQQEYKKYNQEFYPSFCSIVGVFQQPNSLNEKKLQESSQAEKFSGMVWRGLGESVSQPTLGQRNEETLEMLIFVWNQMDLFQTEKE